MSIILKIKSLWKKELQTFQSQIEENKELKKYETKWRDHSVYKDFDTNPLWLKTLTLIMYPPFLKKDTLLYGGYALVIITLPLFFLFKLIG